MDRRKLNQSATGRSYVLASPATHQPQHNSFATHTSHQQHSSNDWEALETSFLKCLREIEKAYLVLPKAQRIRVEKWIEKLVLTGNNPTWRKHRNAYTRLLLNQVIAKHLTEPFNIIPPDGPLPTFPLHLKPAMKDLLGPHETSFWRGVYERYQDVPNKENLIYDGQSFHYQAHEPSNQPPSFAYGREVDNLNLLIKEQNQRIQLLEQQLHEERVKNELQVQRLHYTHRMELNKLLEENTKLSKEVSVVSSIERRSSAASSPARSHGITPQPSTSPSVYFGTRAKRSQSPLRTSLQGNSLLRSQNTDQNSVMSTNFDTRRVTHNNYRYQNVDEDLARSQVISSQQYESLPDDSQPYTSQTNHHPIPSTTLYPHNNLHNQDYVHMPPPPPPEAEVSNVNNLYQGSHRKEFEEHHHMVYGDIANENNSADILPFPKFPLGTDSTLMDNISLIQKSTADDEFLNYLDQFQSELRQVNLDPASLVRLSHD